MPEITELLAVGPGRDKPDLAAVFDAVGHSECEQHQQQQQHRSGAAV